jgi:hypothetical protein
LNRTEPDRGIPRLRKRGEGFGAESSWKLEPAADRRARVRVLYRRVKEASSWTSELARWRSAIKSSTEAAKAAKDACVFLRGY